MQPEDAVAEARLEAHRRLATAEAIASARAIVVASRAAFAGV